MKIFVPSFIASVALVLFPSAGALNVQLPGVNYEMMYGDNKCKSAAEVEADMMLIKKVADKIRIHSLIPCQHGEVVLPAAKKVGLKVELGIQTCSNYYQEKKLLSRLVEVGLFDSNIVTFHVGSNEVSNGEVQPEVALTHLIEIQSIIRSCGKSTAVTVSDTIDTYMQNPSIFEKVDFVSISSMPIRDGIAISDAVSITVEQVQKLLKKATELDKKVAFSEVGWSSDAVGSDQALYMKRVFQMAKAYDFEFYWFTAFDSKGGNGNQLAANFGIFDKNNKMKAHLQELKIELLEPRILQNLGTKLVLAESKSAVVMHKHEAAEGANAVWLYDNETHQLISKFNFRCLTANKEIKDGKVQVTQCVNDDKDQKWTFGENGQLFHSTNATFCLAADVSTTGKVVLRNTCASDDKYQKWTALKP